MATGHSEEDALLEQPDDSLTEESFVTDKVVAALKPCFSELQTTLSSVANGITKMGEVWASLAAKQGPSTSENASMKRKHHEVEMEEEEEELDYDDDDDVSSLINTTSDSKSETITASDSHEASILEAIDASLDEDDDVGNEITPKLASIANKAFSRTLAPEVVRKKQEAYPRPKNCEKVMVPKVNKEIWKRMQGGLLKKRDLRMMNVQRALTKSTFALCEIAEGLLKNEKPENREKLIHACTDSIFLLGHANTSLSLQRRERVTVREIDRVRKRDKVRQRERNRQRKRDRERQREKERERLKQTEREKERGRERLRERKRAIERAL